MVAGMAATTKRQYRREAMAAVAANMEEDNHI
jgi:hypothetical protein